MQVSKSDKKMVQALLLRFSADLDDISDELAQAAMRDKADIQELLNVMQAQIDMLDMETLPAYQKDFDNASKFYVQEIA